MGYNLSYPIFQSYLLEILYETEAKNYFLFKQNGNQNSDMKFHEENKHIDVGELILTNGQIQTILSVMQSYVHASKDIYLSTWQQCQFPYLYTLPNISDSPKPNYSRICYS